MQSGERIIIVGVHYDICFIQGKKEKTSKHQGNARMAKYPKYRQKKTYREPGKGNQIHHIKPTQVINKQTVSIVFFNCLNAHTGNVQPEAHQSTTQSIPSDPNPAVHEAPLSPKRMIKTWTIGRA